MLKKSNAGRTGRVRVTFDWSAEADARDVRLCGEWNGWSPEANPMPQRKDGRFSTTVNLEAGRPYRFKYLVDGQRWENDHAADAYVPNPYGTTDSVVSV
ncbi:MAG: isoamylase early set domain-containing protein [Deltaproteobacteria bacterium]|nr:isoamylase early set domain-containing protein [Deltaproteobacteria bacterium]